MRSLSMKPIPMRLSWITALVFVLLAAVTAYLSLVGINPPVVNLFPVLIAALRVGMAAIAAGLAIQLVNHRLIGRRRRAWLLISAGLLLWFTGEASQLVQGIFTGSMDRLISVGSLFILAGYPAILSGLLYLPSHDPQATGWLGIGLDIFTTSLALTALAGILFLEPLIYSASANLAQIFWAIVFPLFDLALLITTLNLILISGQRVFAQSLSLFAMAFFLLMLNDTVFAYTSLHSQGSSSALPWNVSALSGYFCIVLAGCLAARQDAGTSTVPVQRPNLSVQVRRMLPIASTLIMFWYALVNWQLHNSFTGLTAVATGLCALLIILRQGVSAGETELSQYATLVNTVAEPAFICDKSGKIILANPAFTEITCKPNGHEPSLNLTRLIDNSAQALDLLHAGMLTGWSGEVQLFSKDGTSLPIYLSLRPMLDRRGRPGRLAGTAHDLSEQKRQQSAIQEAYEQVASAQAELQVFNTSLEDKVAEKTFSLLQAYVHLEQQNQTLQQLDQLKSDFVSLVSHELRAPLTNISSGIELVLESKSNLTPSTQQSLELVQAEIHRLNYFVENILDVSALDAGKTPFEAIPMPFEPVLGTLQRQLSQFIGSERIRWIIPERIPFVMADGRALTSIFYHLIDNALKYAPQGPIEIEVDPSETGRLRIAIRDCGPGIPPEALPLLFEKFYRPHKGDAQTVYGHGLGLYVVKKLLHAMNGSIMAENRPAGGACFTFWIATVQEKDEIETVDRG
jgi:PAS domain S-box-containing protein